MKACEGQYGRIFVIRLEDHDVIPTCIESFAEEKKISVGQVLMIGGIGKGQLVVGPRYSDEMPPEPMLVPLEGAHEAVGVGIIAPNQQGKPVLHIHAALGRSGRTITGCLRPGVNTWIIGEVVICEILGTNLARVFDKDTGFELLQTSRT